MKTLFYPPLLRNKQFPHIFSLSILVLIFLYQSAGNLIRYFDNTAALLDGGVWQLLLLSLICFLGFTCLSWYILNLAWSHLGLKSLNQITLQFNDLNSWQQLGFYWASFALLLLAGVGCLVAVF